MEGNLMWMYRTFAMFCEPKKHIPIDKWVEDDPFYLPSNTAEPGPYNLSRAPYQRDILRAMSPEDPAKTVTLVFGSQMGKTTVENIVMCYYIYEEPSPIGFAFSDESNLKNYVKNKFDPMLAANSQIKDVLKSEGKSSADSLNLKQFPGGFLKFLSGKSEASMRSDSIRIMIVDELDGMGITKGGDPKALLAKRLNTFKESSKMCLSSTPLNDGLIYKYLEESTNCHYFMHCPHCNEYMEFTIDILRWKTVGDGVVTEAWMECPHCKGHIHDEDKLSMMDPSQGAKWVAMNPEADPTNVGFYLPSFYTPVGWRDWKDMAQEYVSAAFTSKGVDHEQLTTFYNTILARPYQMGVLSSQDWRILYEKSLSSSYKRGDIPQWINFITTGADVQGNRIEVTVYGWGKLGHSMPIEHIVIPVDDNELDNPNSTAWQEYTMYTLDYEWEREDGLLMRSIANAIDSSYKPDNIYAYWLNLPKTHREKLFPVKGRDNIGGFLSIKKFVKAEGLAGAIYLEVPVSSLKEHIYDHLRDSIKDNAKVDAPFYMEYPCDFDEEFYQQLYSESYVKEGKRWIWKKIRDRNEILDTTVYNFAMYYHIGLGNWTIEDWDSVAITQSEFIKKKDDTIAIPQKRRKLSRGFSL